jgi:hypothetical protein
MRKRPLSSCGGKYRVRVQRRRTLSAEVLTGTPITGNGVMAATIPGRCAAPPAPAMIVCRPLSCAPRAYSTILSVVRWWHSRDALATTAVVCTYSPHCTYSATSAYLECDVRSQCPPRMGCRTSLTSRRPQTLSVSPSPTPLLPPQVPYSADAEESESGRQRPRAGKRVHSPQHGPRRNDSRCLATI